MTTNYIIYFVWVIQLVIIGYLIFTLYRKDKLVQKHKLVAAADHAAHEYSTTHLNSLRIRIDQLLKLNKSLNERIIVMRNMSGKRQ